MTTFIFHDQDLKFGTHIASSSNLERTFRKELSTYSTSFQITLKSLKVNIDDILKTRKLLVDYGKYACVHSSLFYNLAGAVNGKADPKYESKYSRTCRNLTIELDVAAGFGSGVVCHVGSRTEKEKGIFTISKTIEHVLTVKSKETDKLARALKISPKKFLKQRKLILENSAGQGNTLGSTLEEISVIINKVNPSVRGQLKVCIDVAHIFGSGSYNFGKKKDIEEFYESFEELIGLDKLECFHFNDSKVPFNSKKDRHEHLGSGFIFGDEKSHRGFRKFLDKAKEHKIPLICEPFDGDSDDDYAFLRVIYEM